MPGSLIRTTICGASPIPTLMRGGRRATAPGVPGAGLCDNGAMQRGRSIFPFTAIVGQEPMKQALVLNAINPAIGGVLIRGEKGTAKSTAVRALARLLPELEVVADCRFGCPPGCLRPPL